MTPEKFIELTGQMRTAQKEYFKLKHGDPEKLKILHHSKALENSVDSAIENFKNPSLF